MADFGNDPGLWAAKGIGAAAGAAVSLIYMLPKGKREAASRFFTGLSCGLIFGGPAGLWIVTKLDIAGSLSGAEVMLTGSAACSLLAWWVMGAAVRVAERFGTRPD
ncbi:DUF6107 family protein [Pararhizobium sp.]|uniref:DUF6107 family protein n=1 Tax=Pararhizobium sp. TaxID=1977563 RepID=UPI003D0A5E67